jgi:hypothetical protein
MFPPEWLASGVVTPADVADFARYAAARPERPARHWKWAAFRDWAEARERLTEGECRAAFALGEAEPDVNLGTAMMCHVLYRRECPADVRAAGRNSDRPAVRKVGHSLRE